MMNTKTYIAVVFKIDVPVEKTKSYLSFNAFADCESFLESTSPDILALCETNLDYSIDSGNFYVRGYLPLI